MKISIPKSNFRSFNISRENSNENSKDPNVLTFSFASEEPYERYWGFEILSMKNESMIMDRLLNGAPLLFNHDRDKQLGVVTKAWIEIGKAYCEVKFSNSEFAQEKLRDINDGILINVSFGYEILEMDLLKEKKGETPQYLVTKFLPFEVSFVTIPADNTVGIGRSRDSSNEEITIECDDEDETCECGDENCDKEKCKNKSNEVENNNLKQGDLIMDQTEILKQERERVAKIRAMAKEHGKNDLAESFISDGKTPADFAMALVKELGGTFTPIRDQSLDMSKKELNRYSIVRAINAKVKGDWSAAGFEFECHKELQKQLGKETKGFFMPTNIQERAPYMATVAGQGGNLVQTDILTNEFVDALRNKSVVLKAGARQLTGLKGTVLIPRKNGRSTCYWVAENGTITESEATFEQIGFTPKTIGALSVYTEQFLAQSSMSVDQMVIDDLNQEVALGIDYAALHGSGAGGQPTGLINKAGVNVIALGANGAALTYDNIIDMETAVAEVNADVQNMAYVFNARQVGKLKKLKDGQGRYLWDSTVKPFKDGAVSIINGYDIFRSNQLASNLSKGTSNGILSAGVFGDFSQLILAQWGAGIEIVVNPYGSKFSSGGVEVRAMALVDVNTRQEKAFTVVTDAL